MLHRFQHHYTRDEARELLPQIQTWLAQLNNIHKRVTHSDRQITQILTGGNDPGGSLVNNLIKDLCELKKLLAEFHRREIQIKDLARGLIDFPAIVGGREVFLCWEQGEDDIEYWHDLDTGYAGREKL